MRFFSFITARGVFLIVIVGSGLAGLTAARVLAAAGCEDYRIVEQSRDIGGRVATETDGEFLFDVGFAVLNPAYPMIRRYLPLDDLGLGYFDSGALLLRGHPERETLYDPVAHPLRGLSTLVGKFPSWSDRLRTLSLRFAGPPPERPTDAGASTLETLRGMGFSDAYVESFFRPFFAGVFLDRDLEVSGEFFRYLFDFFKRARVALPAEGMKGIPSLLAKSLPREKFLLGTAVLAVEARAVVLADGRRLDAEAVIVAVDESAASTLFRRSPAPSTRSVTTLYYAADELPWRHKLLALNAARRGWVNHLAVLSTVQPTYAKKARHLVSVNGIGTPPAGADGTAWKGQVQRELVDLVGPEARGWTYLRHYVVEKALPKRFGQTTSGPEGVFFAGDYVENPSIQGAMLSGEKAATLAWNALSKR